MNLVQMFVRTFLWRFKIVIWCLSLLYREFPERISSCFIAVEITKTSQQTRNFFRADFLFVFQDLQVTSWSIRSFLNLGLEIPISQNIRHFFRAVLFIRCAQKVTSWNVLFLGIESSISRDIRKTFFRKYKKVSVSQNIIKAFFWKNIRNFFRASSFLFFELRSSFLKYKRNMGSESSISRSIRNFLILESESSIFWNIRNFFGVDFFYFFKLELKSVPGSSILYSLNFIEIIVT